ncbi:hypothetical protein GHT06_018687 [Daphnia sinensis]|uniref:Uncharacterized protein n=1 Tax=Daphnia sinensis TaxID=1820382 RepID=A0AAD5L6B4_9CRUS|nr:hypothetical protein GHT06_018687 [Daphnia sinensis]
MFQIPSTSQTSQNAVFETTLRRHCLLWYSSRCCNFQNHRHLVNRDFTLNYLFFIVNIVSICFFVILLHAGTYDEARLNLPRVESVVKANKHSKKSPKITPRKPQSSSTPILKPPAETVQPQPNYSGSYNLGMPPFWEHNLNYPNSYNQSYTPPPASYDFPSQPMGNISSNGNSSQLVHQRYQHQGLSTSLQGILYPTPTPSPSTVHEFPVSAPHQDHLTKSRNVYVNNFVSVSSL